MTAIDVAMMYIAAGRSPIPIPHKSKAPVVTGWQNLRLTKENVSQYFNGAPQNIGVLLGAASNGEVDVDLDCAEAIAIAPMLLKRTLMFGRSSRRRSHWLYRLTGDPGRRTAYRDPLRETDIDKGMIVELRADGSQTVYPGSVHETGEHIEWDNTKTPILETTREDLEQCVCRVAAASLLARYWPNGSRHDAALAVAGVLAKSGWFSEETVAFVSAICTAANDTEVEDRTRAVYDTFAKKKNGTSIRGFRGLLETFDNRIVERVTGWLNLRTVQDDYDRDERAAIEGADDEGADYVDGVKVAKGPPPAPTAKRIADFVAAQAQIGPIVRLATDIPTFDKAMRGGLPTPRFVVVGGAPGAGKTSLIVRKSYEWAKQGIFVGMLMVDEGPEGAVDRIALYESCKRDRLDEGDESEWKRFQLAVKDLPLIIDDGAMTVEAFAAHIRKEAGPNKMAVMITDSLQTVRSDSGDGKSEGRREQVDRIVAAHKRMVLEHKLLVIATCELSRAYYRSEAIAKELNPLAAFKETGSIEYAAQTALILTTPKGQADLIDVTVAKNRGYKKEHFRLMMHSDLSFHETDRPADEEADVATVSRAMDKAKKEILAALRQSHDLMSKIAIYNRIHGTKTVKIKALEELLDAGTVVLVGGTYRVKTGVGQ